MTTEIALTTDLPPVADLIRLGTELHKTGLLPAHVRSGGQAMAIILAGRELGLAPMTALRSIHLVEGRVTLAADLQLALVKRAGVKHRWLRTDAEAATVELTRNGDAPFQFTYGLEDARRAGLADKQNWRRHTPAMLRARAITAAIRAYCPDLLTSVYDPDELRDGLSGEEEAEYAPISAPLDYGGAVVLPAQTEPAPALPEADPLDRALAAAGLSASEYDRWAALARRPALASLTEEQAAAAAAWIADRGAERIRRDLAGGGS